MSAKAVMVKGEGKIVVKHTQSESDFPQIQQKYIILPT